MWEEMWRGGKAGREDLEGMGGDGEMWVCMEGRGGGMWVGRWIGEMSKGVGEMCRKNSLCCRINVDDCCLLTGLMHLLHGVCICLLCICMLLADLPP